MGTALGPVAQPRSSEGKAGKAPIGSRSNPRNLIGAWEIQVWGEVSFDMRRLIAVHFLGDLEPGTWIRWNPYASYADKCLSVRHFMVLTKEQRTKMTWFSLLVAPVPDITVGGTTYQGELPPPPDPTAWFGVGR